MNIVRRVVADIGRWPASVPPLLQRIYAARGALSRDAAQPKLSSLIAPDALGGLGAASDLLMHAIDADSHIVIVGDFDCDGATAAALAVRGLNMLGAKRITPAVPNRMVHGYGLSPLLVEHLEALKPELLVTVDNGIACHAGVSAAKARGWQVIVTDHHLPGDALPNADAIVNPNLRGDAFPSKALAGVGVMFYVLLALRRKLRDAGRFAGSGEPDLGTLLDLVAVGTVADLVPLDANNRALVAAGLRRMRAGQGNAGLRALIEVSGRDARSLVASDIGFAIGPRLNAAGRLEDMALGIECLLSDDIGHARELAQTLHQINAERKGVQQQMLDEAEAALARLHFPTELPPAIVLFDAQWHPGVIGLVASKLKDRLHRPNIAFAPAEPGDFLRGSARSILGVHIRDALAAVDVQHPGLIERFGGHAMAAGLTLPRGNLEAFRTAFAEVVASMVTPELLQAEVLTDGELQPHEFDRMHAEVLRDGGPWGQGFAEPLFDGEFEVVEHRVLKDVHLKMTLRHPSGLCLSAMHFFGWDGHAPPSRIRIAYHLVPDDWRGPDAIQLLIQHRVA